MVKRKPSVAGEITNGTHLAVGSVPPVSIDRLKAAGIRAFDAHASVRRRAERLLDELDEVTSPHGIVTTELHDEDSAVVVVREALAAVAKDS